MKLTKGIALDIRIFEPFRVFNAVSPKPLAITKNVVAHF